LTSDSDLRKGQFVSSLHTLSYFASTSPSPSFTFCQINTSKTKWKYCSVHASRFRKEHYILEGFQASPVCPTRKNNHVDEDEYAYFVEWYWKKVTEILGEKPVPVPLYRPQFSHTLSLDWACASAVRCRLQSPWAVAWSETAFDLYCI
jgi:hypothetical protein